MRYLLFLLGFYCLSATAASAQTQPVNRRVENRRALRDARKYPAPYKDSHLAVNKQTLTPGEGGRTPEAEEEVAAYKFDKTGTARVKEPNPIGLRLRKKKKAAPTN